MKQERSDKEVVLKIRSKNAFRLLKQLNPYLGKIRIPGEVLETADKLLAKKNLGKEGYVAVFMEPMDGFMDSIMEVLGLDIRQVIIPNDDIFQIETRGKKHPMKKNREWFYYDILLPENMGKVYAVYSMKKK